MQCINSRAEAATYPQREIMFTSLILAKIKSYLKYRETIRQLSRLSDRELEDIGVSRFQIDSLARAGNVG